MLVPKLKFCSVIVDGQEYVGNKYCVWDTEKNDFIEGRSLGIYDSQYECQQAIDFYESLEIVKVS